MSHTPLLIAVHSPLVGPATWQPVARLLRRRFDVMVPRLHGVAAGPGPYACRFAEEVSRDARDSREDKVVIIGHSGAGAYLPVIADALNGRVIGAAFVDAQLPRPGLSDFEASAPEFRENLIAMAHDGMLPPWDQWFPPEVLTGLIPQAEQREAFLAELGPIALTYFQEPAPDTAAWSRSWARTRCTYLQLSEAYQEQADRAEALGWPTSRLAAGHLGVLTDPEPVAEFLSEFVEMLANT